MEPLAYRIKDLPFGKSKAYELIRQKRLETRKVDNMTFVTARSLRKFLNLDELQAGG